jgi:Flp pilus assembly protein TadG
MVGGRALILRKLRNRLRAFCIDKGGNIAVIFALASVPIVTGIGAAIDYSRASAIKVSVQGALDAAVLAGAKDASSGWATLAANIFTSNLAAKSISYSTPSFSKNGNDFYIGSASATVETSILSAIGIHTVPVSAYSKATSAEADNSCILTLDQGQSKSHISCRSMARR